MCSDELGTNVINTCQREKNGFAVKTRQVGGVFNKGGTLLFALPPKKVCVFKARRIILIARFCIFV